MLIASFRHCNSSCDLRETDEYRKNNVSFMEEYNLPDGALCSVHPGGRPDGPEGLA